MLTLHGLHLDPVTLADATATVLTWMEESKARVMVCWNANYLLRAKRDPAFQQLINSCDLRLCDGVPVMWLAKLGATVIPERVAGPDLLKAVLSRCEDKRILVVGDGTAPLPVGPRCIVERYAPPRERFDLGHLIHRIFHMKPHIIIVAMGEISLHVSWFLWAHAKCLLWSVGGALDMVTGVVPRAPVWMQKIGCEWAYRLYREPGRMWRRYAFDGVRFIPLLAVAVLRRVWHEITRGAVECGPRRPPPNTSRG